MRIVDGVMAFPGIVLATAATGYLGPSVQTVMIALSIVLIAPALRVVRGQVLIVRELPMIEAARAVGVPERRILARYMLPAVLSPIFVQASFIFSAAVLGEAALSFIGLGVGPRDVSWGGALTEARNYVAERLVDAGLSRRRPASRDPIAQSHWRRACATRSIPGLTGR